MTTSRSSNNNITGITGTTGECTATMGQQHQEDRNNNGRRQIYLKPRQKPTLDLFWKEEGSSMTESREEGCRRVSSSSSLVTSDSRSSLLIPESTSFDVDNATDSNSKMKSNDLYYQDDDEEYIYKTPYCSQHDYFFFLRVQPPRPLAKNLFSTRKVITWKDYEHRDDLPMMPSLSPTLDDKSNNNNSCPDDGVVGRVSYSSILNMNVPLSLIDIEKREEVEEDTSIAKKQASAATSATSLTENVKVNIPDLVSDSKVLKKLSPKKFLSSATISPKTSALNKAKEDTSFLKANATFKNSRASFTSMDVIRAKKGAQDVGVNQIPPRRKTIHGARAA